MKKVLLLFLVSISLVSYAQDWAPFKTTDTIRHYSSNYFLGPNQSKTIQSVVVKSSIISTNTTTMTFKKGFTRNNSSFNSNHLQVIKGQIIGDSAVINSDSTLIFTTDSNGFALNFPHEYSLSQSFILGENRLNQFLSATVDSIFVDSVNNSLDSIVRLRIMLVGPLGLPQVGSNYNNKEVLITKNNGMIKGIDFTNLETVVEVEQFFYKQNYITFANHYGLTVGDEYHFTDNIVQTGFGQYYESIRTLVADSLLGNMRIITYRNYRKKVFPSPNPGPVQTSFFSDTIQNSNLFVAFESQIIEESFIKDTSLSFIIQPKTHLFYICDGCGFNQLGHIVDSTFFSMEFSFFTNSRDSLRNNRNGLYVYDNYEMIGVGDFGYYSYNNTNSTQKSIVFVKKGNQTWGTPLNLLVGIDEVNQTGELRLYPNPASNQLQIETEEQLRSVLISDINGKAVELNVHNNIVDISNLSSGLYFIQVETEDGILRDKFIKQ